MGRGTTRSVVEGRRPHGPRYPSTILRMVPLPIRHASREETRTAHNPPIVSIFRAANSLITLRFSGIQRHQPAIAGPAPIIPPFRRREGRRALRSCRGGNGMSGRGVSARRSGSSCRPSGPQAASRRAASVRPPLQRAMGREPAPFRGSGSQGSDPPAGGCVGKASRASLVLKRFRPTAPGQTFRAERPREAETHLPTVSGLRARRSAGPSRTFRLTAGEGFSLRESARPPPGPTSGRPEDRLRVGTSRRADDRGSTRTVFENQEKPTKISATTVMSMVRARMESMAAVPNEA